MSTQEEYARAELALGMKISTGAKHSEYLPELRAANSAWADLHRPRLAARDQAQQEKRAQAQNLLSSVTKNLTPEQRALLRGYTTLSL